MAVDSTFVRMVRDDLDYLISAWRPEVTDVTLRMSGTILRRLLIEGGVQRAWKAVGFQKQPTISGPDFEAMLRTIDGKVLSALAGGAMSASSGIEVGGRFAVLVEGQEILFTVSKEEARRIATTDVPTSLTDFVEAPIALMGDEFINRRQLILYVCFKKGAVHYEGTGKRNREPKREQARAFRHLDAIDATFNFDGRSGVFWEFLAVGQQVGKSEDMRRLIEELWKV